MENGVFHSPEVSGKLVKTVEARLHTDADKSPHYERMRELQRELAGTTALPVYLLLDPESERVLSKMTGARGEAAFLEFLRDGGV